MTTPAAAAQVTCPRCRRRSPPTGGPFCPYCGRYLAPLRWVAGPPASAPPPAAPNRFRPPYGGAPRYRSPPRWGFPARAWVPPEPRPARPDAVAAVRALAAVLVPLLWVTAAVTLLTSGAEVWRYALLLASRGGALPAGTVAASDVLVTTAGWLALLLAAVSGMLVVRWTVRAAVAASDRAGVRPSRPPRVIVLGWLVPGANLALPGSVLAEIEHTALGRPAEQRPRPSRLLLAWWGLWSTGVVLASVVVLWSLRTGVQARADGVVLHAVLDLLAAVTAAATAVLVVRLTRLSGPVRPRRRELLVRVGTPTAPGPEPHSAVAREPVPGSGG